MNNEKTVNGTNIANCRYAKLKGVCLHYKYLCGNTWADNDDHVVTLWNGWTYESNYSNALTLVIL